MRTPEARPFERPIHRLQRHLGAGRARGVGTDLGTIQRELDRTAFMLQDGNSGHAIRDPQVRAKAFDAVAHAVATASAHLAAAGDVAEAGAVLRSVERLARVIDGRSRSWFPESGLRAAIAAALRERLETERALLAASDPERARIFATLPDLDFHFELVEGAAAPVLWSEGIHSIAKPGEPWSALGTAPTVEALVRRVVDVAQAGGKVHVEGFGNYRLDGERFVHVPAPAQPPSPMRRARGLVKALLEQLGRTPV